MDPYAILNVDRDASEAKIQSSYKSLSRALHPDKQPPGASREIAQEVFVLFKNAQEILTDPVLRQVYDDHGNEAVRIVKMSMHSPDPEMLYPTLLKYHQLDQKKKAKEYIQKALETAGIERSDHQIQVQTTVELPCSTESTVFLGEGSEPINIPELSGASISVSSTSSSTSKWDMTVGVSSEIDKGKGRSSGSIGIGYKPQQGTQINANADLSNFTRFSLGTTRTLANNTILTATARSIPNSRKMALSLVSHRNLWRNQLRGTWALGVGSDLSMHYSLLSLTTLWNDFPAITAKINLGVNHFPIKLSAKHKLDGENHIGLVSFGWGPSGIELKALLSRAITAYANLSLGIKHATHSGLTWLIQLERGGFTFRVPISISSIISPAYAEKMIYMSFLTYLLDSVIGETIQDASKELLHSETNENLDSKSESHKTQDFAEQQVQLMKNTAILNMEREQQRNGLVIYQARYFVEQGPSVDVSTQLQFWVRNGVLQLPSGSKSHLMGFYTLMKPPSKRKNRWWRRWQATDKILPVPQLCIRYASGDSTYEITIQDTEALFLPNDEAVALGARDRVR
eukprot:CAMPEP_0194222098 /NCGR_PEP_ID=MMETSP0156-20130528/32140_1 /TAXON_ID=33649 /ORGANISM="Thalassionema nitzschioides, Strain L26-B" /LENGTH=570 /DNA_ID=CAMNT_0038952743 /DNA_START=121 /DNA_END=1833 /DNA_ORIENTATION=-